MFYEQWKQLKSPNLADETAELPSNSADESAELQKAVSIHTLQLTNYPNFPIAAFLNLGFSHHVSILTQAKTYEERIFYIQFAADYKVKVDDLEELIKSDLYHHQGNLPNNFKRTIPDQLQAFRAITMFKDEYLLDYINTEELFVRDKDRDEKVIEQGIINNVNRYHPLQECQ